MSIITITRGTRSGGLKLATLLSKRLGYKTLSEEEVIAEGAKKFNVMGEFLQAKLDKTPTLWQKFTNEYGRYIIFIQCSLLDAVKQDNIIYHGHAGQFLLKDVKKTLKVRIEAPLAYRVKSVMKEFNYTHDQAIEYIKKVDDQRKRWAKMVYKQDWYDPYLYDLWFNLKNMSMDNICDIIALTIEHEDFKTSAESIRWLNSISLECSVRAVLACDNQIWDQKITVSAYDGIVTLRGRAKNKEIRDLIVDNASKVKGVKECKSDITLLTDSLS